MIEPTTHRIVVKADKLEDTDQTLVKARSMGLVIPEHEDRKRAQASVDRGIVVSIGPTAFNDFHTSCPIAPGSYVAFAKFSGKLVTDPYTQEEFVVLNDEDIVCIFYKE